MTQRSRKALHSRIAYRQRTSADEQWDLLRALFDTQSEIGRSNVASLLKVSESHATRILSDLRKDHRIEPVGSGRGRSVRYKLAG